MQKLAEGLQRKVEAGEDVGAEASCCSTATSLNTSCFQDIDFKQLAANMKAAQESEQGSNAADLAYQHVGPVLPPPLSSPLLDHWLPWPGENEPVPVPGLPPRKDPVYVPAGGLPTYATGPMSFLVFRVAVQWLMCSVFMVAF